MIALVPPTLGVPYAAVPPSMGADAGWEQAAIVPRLSVSLGPDGRGLTAKATEVRLLWDDDALYIRFICQDDDIYLPQSGRDAELYRGDAAEVFLDVVGDGRQYVELQANAANDLFDQLITVTSPKIASRPDGRLLDRIVERDFWPVPKWNMEGLRWLGRRTASGWTADFAIPARAAPIVGVGAISRRATRPPGSSDAVRLSSGRPTPPPRDELGAGPVRLSAYLSRRDGERSVWSSDDARESGSDCPRRSH